MIFVFCGDISYFYSGTQILKILKDKCAHLIRGNHDDLSVKFSKMELMPIFSKNMVMRLLALKDLSRDDLSFIRRLPINVELSIDGISISISHGMPHNNSIYFYEDFEDWQMEMLLADNFDVYVMGHTHHQLHIRKNGKTLINPGSVGQPRSGRKGAQWCIFDTKLMKVDFITKTYDAAPVFNELSKYGGNVYSYCAEVGELRMISFLVTGAAGDIDNICRIPREKYRHSEIICTDVTSDVPYQNIGANFFMLPRANDENYLRNLTELIERYDVAT